MRATVLLYTMIAMAHAASAVAADGSRQPQYFAKITPFQLKKIDKWVAPEQAPEAVRDTVAAAAPEIKEFLAQVACKANYDAKARSLPASERTPYNDAGPMTELSAHQHRETVCLTVDRIRDWTQPTDRSLAFEVTFRSDDSMETVRKHYVAERQADGGWRFSYAPETRK